MIFSIDNHVISLTYKTEKYSLSSFRAFLDLPMNRRRSAICRAQANKHSNQCRPLIRAGVSYVLFIKKTRDDLETRSAVDPIRSLLSRNQFGRAGRRPACDCVLIMPG